MKLYGNFFSPFVRHCRLALLQSELPFEFIQVEALSPDNKSRTNKIPYFEDGALSLSDSSSILKYIREKSGHPFIPDIEEFELYCFINTIMDSELNLFLFERQDNLLPQDSKHLTRQRARVTSGFDQLEARSLPTETPLSDPWIRLGCFLTWGLIRNRFSLGSYPRLEAFRALCESWEPFEKTAPPRA